MTLARPVALAVCAALALATLPSGLPAQSATGQSPATQSSVTPTPAPAPPEQAAAVPQAARPAKPPTTAERRRAASLYMRAAEAYQKQQFEKALDLDREAAALDPTNPDYTLAAEIARSHAVTALIQQAAHDTTRSDLAAAHAALARALQLDPQNQNVADHIRSLADAEVAPQPESPLPLKAPQLAPPLQISPSAETHSFHLNADLRQIIPQVYSAYGIKATVDAGVRGQRIRLDIDDATFAQAMRALALLTNTFYVPLDVGRVLVVRDNTTNRMELQHNALDTVYLAGLSQPDMTEMGNVARNVFDIRQVNVDPGSGVLAVRGPVDTVKAFKATYQDLSEGRSQVLVDIRLIQIAHLNGSSTGLQLPQTVTAFNVYSEEQQILQQNAALVQQIISSGLVAPGDTLAILGILIASGAVPAGLFSNGILIFGGGLTQTALVPNSGLTLNLNVNSSDSRELDNYRIRLEDGEEGTLKSGSRYPIMTSSFSNLGVPTINIPGISGAGTSAGLAGLLATAGLASANIPQFQYQDLGLVLKARPRVLRSNNVALELDMKITALAGAAVNNVPILANRSYTGAVTVPSGQAVVLASEIDKTESRAISGYPGLSEIPGFDNITSKDTNKNYATLVIILTPHVVRSPHPAGRTPMLLVDKTLRNR